MKLLAKYKNGNYFVKLYDDGTKVKYAEDEFFNAEFPDSMDIKITNYCDLNCPMCHEMSSVEGSHAHLNELFFDTLPAGVEVALGGGNPLSHPELVPFLERLAARGIIANLTVNEQHFLTQEEFLASLLKQNLIRGLGISLNEINEHTLEFARKNGNVVFHVIAGIFDENGYKKLQNNGFKILILGYKKFGRGVNFFSQKIEKNIAWMEDEILNFFDKFNVVSFDNLALEQLSLKSKIDPKIWAENYMGDDGEASMYIDLVEKKFARSSTSKTRFKLKQNIVDMFSVIKVNN